MTVEELLDELDDLAGEIKVLEDEIEEKRRRMEVINAHLATCEPAK